MPKKIRFKPEHAFLNVKGIGIITNDNINPELLERLIGINPSLGAFFEEEEVKEKPKREIKSE